MTASFASKCHGVLLGQAVGDALGTTVEFDSAEGIGQRDSSDGWPKVMVGKGPFQVRAGQVTDDTELALALARSLVAEGRYDDDAVARAYLKWMQSDPWDFGRATRRAFTPEGTVNVQGSMAAFIRARADPMTQANGSLMRSSPLGVFGHALPRVELAKLAARDSTLSHPHVACQAACGVFTATIAEALSSSARSGEELYDWALNFAAANEVTRPVVQWLESAGRIPPPHPEEQQGWVRIALETAFFHLRHATSFEGALQQVVLAGGDTDTNGAITGALLGAAFGEEAIPAAWRECVVTCAPARPKHFQCGDLVQLADVLAQLSP